jgi:two-component system OmpR family sensor kinase
VSKAASRRPFRIQTRLIGAVIGIVSLMVLIVAGVTSATLGRTLEDGLDRQLSSTASTISRWTHNVLVGESTNPGSGQNTAASVVAGRSVPPGVLVVVIPTDRDASGVVVEATSDTVGQIRALHADHLHELVAGGSAHEPSNIGVAGYGSYRVISVPTINGEVVVGLPRAESQRTLGALITSITLTTLGGLLVLALTTALVIRYALRPLRAVAETATRVASTPLDSGAVSITERVPAEQADPRTETGAVGAALNTLLEHVDNSLAVRQQKEQQMRRFVADASHELRTPLASIRGYSELSLKALDQQQVATEDTKLSLERIQAQSLRMTRLVEDLLLLARLDEGQELVYDPIDLTQLALEGVTDIRLAGPDHNWAVSVPDEPVTVIGDSGRLNQVIVNMLSNAITHTPAGTTITVSVSEDEDAGIVRVHDTGPGIEPQIAEELFARFVRGDSSRTRQTGGAGLGMAIAKAIVESHGGTIEVHSQPGDTTFTVRLPKYQ